jgi:SNF2 family DNA or RNA helicase
MTAAEKADAVEKFQNGSVSRVIVGNALTMGLGVTLTRAPTLVSVEADWNPGVNEQMEDRIHRIGQTKHCYIRYLVLRDSLDERMLRRALEKEENIRKLMNRKEKA